MHIPLVSSPTNGNPPLPAEVDVLIVGGGLAAAIIALRLADVRPEARLRVLERETPGSASQTWCLFQSDVTPDQWSWLRPLFAHEWDGYEVRFPKRSRNIRNRYACITSASLRARIEARLDPGIFRHRVEVGDVGAHDVTLVDGTRLSAGLVIDARGARPSRFLKHAWQKFVGLEVQLAQPHRYERPLLMDATVEQEDGFRFLYVLPLGPERLLIEDTRYSTVPHLDHGRLEQSVREYASKQGLQIAAVLRRESGALPVVLDGDPEALGRERGDGASVGMRGGFFHPTTGYSLPQAVATAFWIASEPRLDTSAVAPALAARALRHWKRGRFYRALNRMLFLAAEPPLRYRVLERFYGLSQELIARFYAGRLTMSDKLRLIVGRPPVPVLRAARALPPQAAWRAAVD